MVGRVNSRSGRLAAPAGAALIKVPGNGAALQPRSLNSTRRCAPERLRHDGNSVLTWCIGNVVGKADRRGNLYPTKQRPEQKIDAAVAVMMAIGRAMVEDENQAGLNGFLANPIAF